MFLVTNRKINTKKSGVGKLGNIPNIEGPHELRLAVAERENDIWQVKILRDKITREMKKDIGVPYSHTVYASQYVANQLIKKIETKKRNLLFFVHGYNNDVEQVLTRAETLADLYNVEVVPFTWPANGGGLKGVVSYKSDKRDARASVGAFSQVLVKIRELLLLFNEQRHCQILEDAKKKYPNNHERQQIYVTTASQFECRFTVNLMLHSMGNYLFKQVMNSTTYEGDHLLFDNIVMVAADVNNHEHVSWVDRINCRRQVYITINEDDFALRFSRIKSGEEQLARLGHYPHNLYSKQAVYVDFTNALNVGSSHAYFEGEAASDESGGVFNFFKGALNGERVEQDLDYDSAKKFYRII